MRLVNLTGHPFSIYDVDGAIVHVEPDPRYVGIAAVGDHRTLRDEEGHTFSITERRVTAIKGMPEPRQDTIFVVPVDIAMALQEEREDVVYLGDDVEIRRVDGSPQRISHLQRTLRRRAQTA